MQKQEIQRKMNLNPTFTTPPLRNKAQLTPAQIAARRKGGKARAKSFTREYQQAASRAQKEKYNHMLSVWGEKGFYRAMQAAGFRDTTLMNHLKSKFS
jgi:hypothetical protein